ncbi:gag-pol polyprotein [Tanacetum coccineum]|uniref:Gag-pol polyprotein n=1 Tax=Tanacetum coccineum TaxID=301880 RepID=A0ABQ4XB85_9ASTR
MNKTLALMAKAFKFNTIPTNNKERSSLISRNSQIAQPDMNTSQDIKMQMVDDNVGNQMRQNAVQNDGNEYGNGNIGTAPTEGNGNGINGNPIRCYNCRGEGHYASNCTVKPRKRYAAYLQQQLQIAQEEEAWIQSTQDKCEIMAANAYEETERVKVNCTSEDTLQQASTSGTQSDNARVYDSDGSTEIPKDENCYDHDIFNILTHEYTKCEECKYDKISYDKAYNDMQQTIKRLQAQLGDLKGKSSDTQCASNTLDPLSQKPEDENVSLKFQQQANSDLNDFSSTRVNNTAKTRRPHHRRNSNTDRVLSKSKISYLSNNIEKIEENHRNSQIPKNQKHMSSECNNITLAIRNAKSEIVCIMCKQCLVTANHDVCVFNYVNDMNSHVDNQSTNVSKRKHQKKHKANAKKSKELGSKGRLASSRPNKPRTCLRWILSVRIFSMCGKLTTSSNTENKSKKSVCDNASTSNPSKPSSKGFSNSASLLGRLSRLRKQHTSIYPIAVL